MDARTRKALVAVMRAAYKQAVAEAQPKLDALEASRVLRKDTKP